MKCSLTSYKSNYDNQKKDYIIVFQFPGNSNVCNLSYDCRNLTYYLITCISLVSTIKNRETKVLSLEKSGVDSLE